MSDNQKLIISVLGAVVGHLLLFLLLALLFTVANLIAPTRSEAATAPAPPPPEEITILLADLMEQIDLTPKELTQQYMRTDADQASDVAPESTPFHSDHNTLATSSRTPEIAEPGRRPSVAGRDDLPFLEIRDRELVDGEFLDTSLASAPAPASQATPAVEALPTPPVPDLMAAAKPEPIRDPSEIPAETEQKSPAPPAEMPREAPEARPEDPADADTPPDTLAAEREIQPDSLKITDTPLLAQREKTFESPFPAESAPRLEDLVGEDREAEAMKKVEETGEAAAPETPRPASSMPVAKPLRPSLRQTSAPDSPPSPAQAAGADLPPTPKPTSTDPAFNPHTRAREMTGNAANVGDTPAFDVEASALGRYKKAVTQAVERQWHRYRERNLDFVTYGTLKVKFRVDKNGKPRNLKLVKNDSNAVMAEFTLRAVLDADIPEMPEEVASMLGSSGLEIFYDVIVY